MSRVILVLMLLVSAGPAVARSNCDEILASRNSGVSEEDVKAALQTTLGRIRSCEQAATIRERIADHRERAADYRLLLQQRFNP